MTENAKDDQGALSEPEQWLKLYGDELFRFALVQLHDAGLAEDMVQETLLAALQARDRYSGEAAVKTWLIGILKHKIVDHIRKEVRESAREDIERLSDRRTEEGIDELFDARGHWIVRPQDWGDPESCLEQGRFWDALEICLQRLKVLQARIFALKEFSGLSNEEICKELEITATNCWVLLYRARVGLRQCLEAGWHGDSREVADR
ncbi:MAG TPA: sigma-70 family RNA polymerase sigma factor [Gammaproteobacteria bacterium]|nr:sigma-70 family RNA polymerase sigma factor [Gammaproteobacteria bacterium]